MLDIMMIVVLLHTVVGVRMVSFGQFIVRFLNLLLGRVSRNTQYFVIVFDETQDTRHV